MTAAIAQPYPAKNASMGAEKKTQRQRKDGMENETLKPCPFCGETPDVDNPNIFEMDQGDKWAHVVCCCAGPEVRTDYQELEHWKQRAIDAWNERVMPNVELRGCALLRSHA